jgi:hypothetical protein
VLGAADFGASKYLYITTKNCKLCHLLDVSWFGAVALTALMLAMSSRNSLIH